MPVSISLHSCAMPAATRVASMLALLFSGNLVFASDVQGPEAVTTVLNPVVVTGAASETDSFDLPYSINAVDLRDAQRINLGVNASEYLAGVPGLVIQNRQNYAQDLQISIRGFGARAAFGVRGVKLITDGIPASNPDGQGQAATFNLDTAERIEVMRGPFSTVYGNHAGGVVQMFSRNGEGPPTLGLRTLAGSWGSRKHGLSFEGESGGVAYVVDASRFSSKGYRDHSKATRDQAFVKFNFAPDADSRLSFVASSLHQPETLDPQGISWDQYKRDPRSVDSAARDFNTRKRIAHLQGGFAYERDFGPDTLQVTAYTGKRSVVQYQSIPRIVQIATPANPERANHAGGVIDFDRTFSGMGVRWTARRDLAGGDLTVTTGLDYDQSRDDRRGWENFVGTTLGVRGNLRRDEIDTVTSTDPYVQAIWAHGPWQWSAGLRHSHVRFKVKDKYIVGVNGDDSGSVSFRQTTPALGLTYALNPAINLYASAGAGFETPTLNELSYSANGGGFNFDLKPSKSRQFEVGMKAFVGNNTRLDLAVFHITTRDEIVVAEATGGRTTFKNASKTTREGLELALRTELTPELSLLTAITYTSAKYSKGFETRVTNINLPSQQIPTWIPSGNKLPGIPEWSLQSELVWTPRQGLSLGAEVLHRSKLQVNDLNGKRPTVNHPTGKPAPAYTLVNLRVSAEQNVGAWTFNQLARVDNVFNRKHIGAVIVGNAQARYYEPGPTRSWYVGLGARHSF